MKNLPYLISIPLQLLGLTGLVDNIIVWQGFLKEVLAVYDQAKVFIFGWLPFEMPSWIEDYLVIGFAVSASYMRAVFIGPMSDFATFREPRESNSSILSSLSTIEIAKLALGYLFLTVAWPLAIVTTVYFYFFPPKFAPTEALVSILFWRSFVVVIVAFLGCLFIFSDVIGRL